MTRTWITPTECTYDRSRAKALRKQLGEGYSFKRWISGQALFRLQRNPPKDFTDTVIAELVVGCVKMEAVAFKEEGQIQVGYDVFVKDAPTARDWICYDTSNNGVQIKESEMLSELDRVVSANGLSYTQCCFDKLEGLVAEGKIPPKSAV